MAIVESHIRVERFRFVSFDAEPAEALLPDHSPLQAKEALPSHPLQEEPATPPAPPPPMFSEQEVEQARTKAFDEGLAQGRKAAEQAIDIQQRELQDTQRKLMDLFCNRITLAAEAHAAILKSQQEVMFKTIMAIARKVAGDALKREPLASVEALVKECGGLMAGQSIITLTVPQGKSEALRQMLDMLKPLLADYKGELQVMEDGNLTEGDCRVEWGNGQAERNTLDLWNEIEERIKKAVLSS